MNDFEKNFSKCRCDSCGFPQEWNFDDCNCRDCKRGWQEDFSENDLFEGRKEEQKKCKKEQSKNCCGFCGECCCNLKWHDEEEYGKQPKWGCDHKDKEFYESKKEKCQDKIFDKDECRDSKEDEGRCQCNCKNRCCRRGLFCFRFYK